MGCSDLGSSFVERGLILSGWGDLRRARREPLAPRTGIPGFVGDSHPQHVALGCLESRACSEMCQGAAAAASLWGGSAGKRGWMVLLQLVCGSCS